MFQSIFERIAKQYPQIQTNHEIVDIATARVAARPTNYDIIVTLNLYGDIISDVAAEVAGSVGLAGSANVGTTSAMFEAIHGSAPDIAGKDIANPGGMLNGALMMLNYLKQHDVATNIHNAMLKVMSFPDLNG
jgi:isocitrate dehydrogenase